LALPHFGQGGVMASDGGLALTFMLFYVAVGVPFLMTIHMCPHDGQQKKLNSGSLAVRCAIGSVRVEQHFGHGGGFTDSP
jgi:hypothetical protein